MNKPDLEKVLDYFAVVVTVLFGAAVATGFVWLVVQLIKIFITDSQVRTSILSIGGGVLLIWSIIRAFKWWDDYRNVRLIEKWNKELEEERAKVKAEKMKSPIYGSKLGKAVFANSHTKKK